MVRIGVLRKIKNKRIDSICCRVILSYGGEKMNPTLTIRLPEDMRTILNNISKEKQQPVSDIVRESIRKYVSIYQFRKICNKVLPFAEAQGLLTDEDIFEALK